MRNGRSPSICCTGADVRSVTSSRRRGKYQPPSPQLYVANEVSQEVDIYQLRASNQQLERAMVGSKGPVPAISIKRIRILANLRSPPGACWQHRQHATYSIRKSYALSIHVESMHLHLRVSSIWHYRKDFRLHLLHGKHKQDGTNGIHGISMVSTW